MHRKCETCKHEDAIRAKILGPGLVLLDKVCPWMQSKLFWNEEPNCTEWIFGSASAPCT